MFVHPWTPPLGLGCGPLSKIIRKVIRKKTNYAEEAYS
jgi:hypothetical protein